MTTRFLIRGGCVLTLGARTPNHHRADVLVVEGEVAEVGPGIRARDAEMVDATDAIVMPGFVDTHRHCWRSLFRNLGGGTWSGHGPAGVSGQHFRPEDLYAATYVGLLGAAEAGITTVVDWPEVPLDEASADAVLRAHADAGVRTVLVHPVGTGGREGGGVLRATLTRLIDGAGPSTTVAVGVGGRRLTDPDGLAGDLALARELGLRTHVHAGPDAPGPGLASDLAARGLLGEDVTFVHCSALGEADLDAIAASGASVCLAPSSEMAAGLGTPPIQQLIDRDIRPGLGVDEERVAPGDLFAQIRAAISWQHARVFDLKLMGKAGLPRLLTTRDVIRHATIDGARAAGMGEETGSLEPGKRADLIVLRTDRPNIFPINDPIGAVVWGMDTSNLSWVLAGGRVLMREGILQADVRRARELATAVRERVAGALGPVVGAAPRGEG